MNDERIEDIMSTVFLERTGKPISAKMQEYSRLQKAYEQRFGEQLVFSAVGREKRSHIDVLRECLLTGKPYEHPDTPEDCKT